MVASRIVITALSSDEIGVVRAGVDPVDLLAIRVANGRRDGTQVDLSRRSHEVDRRIREIESDDRAVRRPCERERAVKIRPKRRRQLTSAANARSISRKIRGWDD